MRRALALANDYERADAIEAERERILSGDECLEFGESLLREQHDDLVELLTGAYGYGDTAMARFSMLLKQADERLTARALRNLEPED
jgi:hypothetical protein